MNWPIFGHRKQIAFLKQAIDSDKIAHAYIFVGPQMVGKKTVAMQFAEILLRSSVKNNPDYIELSGIDGIKIDAIRSLAYKLSLKPYMGEYKVAVIDDAQNLTVEAANALLKIFEEPRPRTTIVLITDNPQRLLPTIRSRAQKITFGLAAPDDYAKLLEQKIDKTKGQLIRSLALGRPGMVLRILNADDEEVERLKQILDYFAVLTKGDLVEKMKMAYEVADLETPQIREILDAWISLVDTDKADNLIKARGMIERNVNSKLLLSDLILKFTA